MFKTLYKYIIGLNEDNKEIEMTRPGKTPSHAYLHEFWIYNLFYEYFIHSSRFLLEPSCIKKRQNKVPIKTLVWGIGDL